MDKIGTQGWTIGKLLSIVLLAVFLVLVIWGVSTEGLVPLKDKVVGMYDNVLAMFGFGDERRDSGLTSIALFTISALVWLISFLLIRALSRYREFAADMGSAILTRKPRALISALLKISGKMERISPNAKKEVEGMNAFFIIPAISGESILSLFSTHPPIEKRIAILRAM